MADDLLRPIGAEITTSKTSKTLKLTRSVDVRGARDIDAISDRHRDEDSGRIEGPRRALPEFKRLDDDIERAIQKIGRAAARLLRRLDRLENKLERLAERLEANIAQDIREGNFEDRTPDRAISKAMRHFERLEQRAERITERFYQDISRAIGGPDAGEGGEAGEGGDSVDVSQSLVLTVERLEINTNNGDGEVALSYERLIFSISSSVGLAVTRPSEEVHDAEGQSVDIATQDSGIFLASEVSASPALLTALTQINEGQGGEGGEAGESGEAGEAGESPASVESLPTQQDSSGLGALFLLQQANFSASFQIDRLVLSGGARIGPTLVGNLLTNQEGSDLGSTLEVSNSQSSVKLTI